MVEADAVLRGLEHDRRIGLDASRDEVEGPVARVLLVHDALDDDLPPQRHAGLAQVRHRQHRRDEPALHVGRAAPIHEAVLELRAEGRMAPLPRGLDRHAVDVAVEDQRTPAAGAREAADHVGPAAVVEHALEAALAQRRVGGQLLVRQDQVVPPMGRILGDVREAIEDEPHVGFARFHRGPHAVKHLGHARLGLALLAREARDPHQPGERLDAAGAIALRVCERRFGYGVGDGVGHGVPFDLTKCA
jgi:hypothetical protein